MAKCGNHGQIIPRDRELLHRLRFVEGKSLSEMARLFGVTNHNSVGNVLRAMGFPRPGQGCRPRKVLCIECGKVPPVTLQHKLTKNGTGTRCLKCLRAYKARWTRNAARTRPEVREYRRKNLKRWYEQGPLNPQGELQWIIKSKHLLRTNRRLLKAISREASPCSTVASATATTLPR